MTNLNEKSLIINVFELHTNHVTMVLFCRVGKYARKLSKTPVLNIIFCFIPKQIYLVHSHKINLKQTF